MQEGADDGGGGAQTPAALQVVQVLHREPMGQPQLVVLQPLDDLVSAFFLIPQLDRLV